MTESILDLLEARRGIVCAVGAGGKKTTLYRLAAAHPGKVGITTTVFMAAFPEELQAARVVVPQAELAAAVVASARENRQVVFACPSEKKERLGGLAGDSVQPLHQGGGFDLTLVKADGARMRQIKAPAAQEPNIPVGADVVLFLVSARAIGQPLDEAVAHRVECLESVTGAHRGEPIEPRHVARLLTATAGARQNVGDALLIPIINQVDTPERRHQARAVAEQALAEGDFLDRIVLTSMHMADPVVDVIRRT
ncbi:MAG: putative selenium-dependent hydroxylase accessory protein YqeC [Nitrococcus sp.]|nr:putative selenium-dependent hydroxylase accessory protein YqeC [Nitrococcus sp.]